MKKVLGDPPGHGGAQASLRGAAPAFESPSWGFCSVFVLGQPLDKSSRPRDTRRSWFRRLRVALTVEAGAISFGSQTFPAPASYRDWRWDFAATIRWSTFSQPRLKPKEMQCGQIWFAFLFLYDFNPLGWDCIRYHIQSNSQVCRIQLVRLLGHDCGSSTGTGSDRRHCNMAHISPRESNAKRP